MLQPRGYSATPRNNLSISRQLPERIKSARVDFPHEFLMGKMNDAPLDHDRDLVVLSNAASDLHALQSHVPP